MPTLHAAGASALPAPGMSPLGKQICRVLLDHVSCTDGLHTSEQERTGETGKERGKAGCIIKQRSAHFVRVRRCNSEKGFCLNKIECNVF